MEHMDWNGIIEMLLGQYIAHWTNNPYYVQIHQVLGSCFFFGPSKMRTNQKTHQLKQYKPRGHVGPFGVAIK